MILLSILLAAETNVWLTVVAPITTAVIGAISGYVALRYGQRAKQGDQVLAAQASEYEGINIGQAYMKDSLADARNQIEKLKTDIETISKILATKDEEIRKMAKQNASLERKIEKLEVELETLRTEPTDDPAQA